MDIDTLLYLIYSIFFLAWLTIAAAVGCRCLHVWQQNRRRACRLLAGVSAFVLLLACTYALGSDAPVHVGGSLYAEGLWLRVADALLYAVYFLLGLSVLCVLLAACGVFRKIRTK